MTAILFMLGGALIGAIIAIFLYVLGFGVELLNCACQIITCDCDGGSVIPDMWKSGSFMTVLIFCTIGGAVIGLCYGVYTMKMEFDAETARKNAENSEEARKQRVKWADEIKEKALNVSGICEHNHQSVKPLVSVTYKSDTQMESIMKELSSASELLGKVDAMAEDVKKKGGSAL